MYYMAYSAKSQKAYNDKCKIIRIKYSVTDMNEYDRVQKYIKDNSITITDYIKGLIKSDLDKKGIKYEQTEQPESDTK